MRRYTQTEQSNGKWAATNSVSKRARDGYANTSQLKIFAYDFGEETRYAYDLAGDCDEDMTIGQLERFLEGLTRPEKCCTHKTGNCMSCECALMNWEESEPRNCEGMEIHASREAMEKEAVKRMHLMGVFPETIKQFEQDGLISQTIGEACYWLDVETMKRVREFELRFHTVVYHVVPATYAEIGQTETYFYVGDTPSEWKLDCMDILDGSQLCYVRNLTYPDCSEFGSIGFALTRGAGLKRTW